MKVAMEVALSEAGDDVRRRVESTATVGGANTSTNVGAGAGVGVDADPLHRGNPNQWADKARSWVQFGYDADVECERWWAEHGQRAIGVPVVARM